MLDFSGLPKPQNGTIDYFPGFSSTDGGAWEVWNKPRNCMFIRILCIGGGAGGASGFPSATTTARGGGSGGFSSGYNYGMYPASFLPDRLYISSGVGGAGGESSTSASNAGQTGVASHVCIAPSTANIYRMLFAYCGSPGLSASASAGGAVGTATVTPIQNALQGFQGHFGALPGNISGSGGFSSIGSEIGYPINGVLLTGGAGGAGNFAKTGGNVGSIPARGTGFYLFQIIAGGVAGTAGSTIGGNGGVGVELYQPLLSTGGSGGGSSFNGTAKGGNGGNGGFGSGGGGGGAGGTDGGGSGGAGGSGLVVIHTW